jgi:hypothetical protein
MYIGVYTRRKRGCIDRSQGSRRFSEAWSEFTREVELSDLDIDPDQIFSDLWDTRPGRDVGL